MTKEWAMSASIVSVRFNLVRPFLDHVAQSLGVGRRRDHLLSVVNGQSLTTKSCVTNHVTRKNNNNYYIDITTSQRM